MLQIRTVTFERDDVVQRFAESVVRRNESDEFCQTFHSVEGDELIETQIDRFESIEKAQVVHLHQIVERQIEPTQILQLR